MSKSNFPVNRNRAMCRHKPRWRRPATDLTGLTHGETHWEMRRREVLRYQVSEGRTSCHVLQDYAFPVLVMAAEAECRQGHTSFVAAARLCHFH